jgi:gliding motility-associated-like protein
MKRPLFVFFCFFVFLLSSEHSKGSHMVGGGFSYTYLSENRYLVQLDYYKDCSANAVDYPPGQLRIGIYRKKDNTLVQKFDLWPGPIVNVNIISAECANAPINCVQKRIYSDTLSLDAALYDDSTGYYLSYEQCCRNFGIKNIQDPDKSGIAYYADFLPYTTQAINAKNSSPVLINEQNVYLCISEPFEANYAHFDPDGDSLVYRLIDPLVGSTDPVFNNSNGITVNNAKPYEAVQWATSYGFVNNNILDGNPDLSMDLHSGLLSVKPTQTGMYSFAYAIEEYRNGKLLAIYNREVQYHVIFCSIRNAPEINQISPIDTVLKADSSTCLLFEAKDINLQDSLTVFIESLSSIIPLNAIELSIDSSIPNNIKFKICIKLACSAPTGTKESLRLIVRDNSCPSFLSDSLLLDFKIMDKVNLAPQLTWLNPNENELVPNSKLCYELLAFDPNPSDSIELQFSEFSKQLIDLDFEIKYDTLSNNEIKAVICFITKCFIDESNEEGFKVKLFDNGCPDLRMDSIRLNLIANQTNLMDPLLNIPNVFSPNGDGKNDFFNLKALIPSECVDDFHLSIYNRWGELVYESKNFDFNWSGDGLASGVYFYVIKLDNRQKIGHLSIMY